MTNSPRHQEHNNTHSHTHKKNTHTAKKKELRRTRRIHGRNRRYPEEKEGFGIPFFLFLLPRHTAYKRVSREKCSFSQLSPLRSLPSLRDSRDHQPPPGIEASTSSSSRGRHYPSRAPCSRPSPQCCTRAQHKARTTDKDNTSERNGARGDWSYPVDVRGGGGPGPVISIGTVAQLGVMYGQPAYFSPRKDVCVCVCLEIGRKLCRKENAGRECLALAATTMSSKQ